MGISIAKVYMYIVGVEKDKIDPYIRRSCRASGMEQSLGKRRSSVVKLDDAQQPLA